MAPQFFILVALLLTSLTLSAALFTAWLSFDRKPHALLWALAYLIGAAQWATNLFGSAVLTDRATYWLVVNAIPLGILGAALAGHRLRVGLPSRWLTIVAVCLAIEAGVAWFTIAQPHVGLQMAIQPAFAGVVMMIVGATILRSRTRLLPAEWGAVVVHAAFGAILLAGAGCALMQGAAREAYWFDWYLRINFLLMPTGYVSTGVFAIFLLASDLSEAMRRLARTDQLTMALNRRGFEIESSRALADARARRRPLAIVMGDIDRFKAINDTYGHEAGDAAIRGFAQQLQLAAPNDAFVARIGGEEFVLVVPGADAPRAFEVAELVRNQLAASEVRHADQPIRVTASFGVSQLQPGDKDVYDVLRRADAALYRAKEDGRNRVSVAA